METSRTDTAITFDRETHTYRLHHDWQSDRPLSTAVVMGVAAVTNTPPTEFDPLFETVDPDALEHLFNTPRSTSSHDDGRISFRFHDCEILVTATGAIEITPIEDGNPITEPVPETLRDR